MRRIYWLGDETVQDSRLAGVRIMPGKAIDVTPEIADVLTEEDSRWSESAPPEGWSPKPRLFVEIRVEPGSPVTEIAGIGPFAAAKLAKYGITSVGILVSVDEGLIAEIASVEKGLSLKQLEQARADALALLEE